MTYSIDFRKKALEVKAKDKLSFAATAQRFGISKAALFRWSKKIEPAKGRNRKSTKINMKALQLDIEQYPDSYIYERAKRFGASYSGIRDAMKKLGVTYKKNPKSSESGFRKKICILQTNKKI